MPLDAVLLQIDKAEPLARPEWIWLALGTVLMLLGMVYFIARGWGVEPPARHFYTITILIPAIAAASYLSMFLGFGVTEVTLTNGETRPIYWARYADWLLTTPLLLLDLNLLAGADRDTIQTLAVLDVFMIGTGLVGALTQVPTFRYIWWTVSTIALLVIVYFLFVNLTQKAETLMLSSSKIFLVSLLILFSSEVKPVPSKDPICGKLLKAILCGKALGFES